MTLEQFEMQYTPVGDIIAIALSLLLGVLVAVTYVSKTKAFSIFQWMLTSEGISAIADLIYHQIIATRASGSVAVIAVYTLRMVQHIASFIVPYLFMIYLLELLVLPRAVLRRYCFIGGCGFIFLVVTDLALSLTGKGFAYRPEEGYISEGNILFVLVDLFYIGILFFILFRYHKRMVRQIFIGLSLTVFLCVLMQTVQGMHYQTSFTTVIFMLPIIALMYLLHSTPYETTTGAINEASFSELIAESYAKKHKFRIMFLHIMNFEGYNSFTEEMQFAIFRFFTGIVKRPTLFRVAGGRLALVFREKYNPDVEATTRRVEEDFSKLYEKLQLSFKTVVMDTDDVLSKNQSYADFLIFMEDRIPANIYYHVTEKDIELYKRRMFILEQLEDIAEGGDMDDPRVLVYCQPVYHVRNQLYDTAEALMRLKLPELGMVFPDQFIPLAEEHRLIHRLSLVILNKTCRELRRLLDENYVINRISVNFAVQEVYDEHFCEDVLDVIRSNGVPCDKIAIELTESQSTADFEMIKARIEELQGHGIKFYLDDFGTGYSNVERIMELPFDIIKFDRSLVIESSKNKNSEYMVNTFADMFHNLDYRVLYEGVEDKKDEERCIRMYAQYLQGYKYSKPIEIERLRDFLAKAA